MQVTNLPLHGFNHVASLNDKVVSANGFTHGQLAEAFDKLTEDMKNWKMPINTRIDCTEETLMKDACSYFTGSSLEIVLIEGEVFNVEAKGYYVMEAGYYRSIQ